MNEKPVGEFTITKQTSGNAHCPTLWAKHFHARNTIVPENKKYLATAFKSMEEGRMTKLSEKPSIRSDER
jgi:hypothetical protein